MYRTIMIGLMVSVLILLAVPANAEFYGMSDYDVVYTVDNNMDPPEYWLEGFTFIDHNTPFEDLVLGESSGVVNVGGAGDITSIDDFDLNSFAPRNGATPPEFQTRNFGGSPIWQDTNGDGYDFFIFEAGRNDEFAVQAILPGGVFGQKVIVTKARWEPSIDGEPDIALNRTPGPNNNQLIGGIAFKITDLLDENGNPLTNESIIEGLQFTSPGMDPSCVCAVVGSPAAFNPDPADQATIDNANPVLMWSSGAAMVSQKVFFSENLADVESLTDSALLEETALTISIVWGPGTTYPDGLPSGTYYWRIVTIKDDQTEVSGQVWSFSILPGSAHNPVPVDGAIFVDPDMDLSWNAGLNATIHTVYFSSNRDEVENGTNPATVVEATFDPGTLGNDTTYFWRVDEFNGTEFVTGDIWSFTTLPAGSGGLQAEYFSNVTDLTGVPLVTRVDPQIDFNWNQETPAPGIIREMFSVRWIGEIEIPVTDTYTFTTRSNDGSRIYVDDQLIINDWGTHTARDTLGTLYLEAGAYPIVVEYMQDGANANIVVSWESSLISKQTIPSAVLSPVVRAGLVWPAKGSVDISQNPRLTWTAASADAKHELYIGDDADMVAGATTATAGIYKGQFDEATNVVENLEPGKTYYWRIDEIIAGDPQSPIKGNVWSFTTAKHVVIDDIENYNIGDDQIWYSWKDGLGFGTVGTEPYSPGNGTGSAVGLENTGSYTEETIVHGGRQSLPMAYNNVNLPYHSEIENTVAIPQDWTSAYESDLEQLVLWYRGVASQGTFDYDADKDRYTIAAGGTGIDGTSDEFRFAYKQLTSDGVVTVRVDSLENTNTWAVSGVMIRNTLDSGSVFAMCGVRAAGQAFFRWRTAADSDLAGTAEEPPFPATIVMPHWVRLTRQGNSITAEHSSDGTTWEPIGNPAVVTMNQQVFVGLAVSPNVGAENPVTATSVLSMPDITGTVDAAGPFEMFVDVGMPINSPDNLYIVIKDSTGSTAVIDNPDNPTAVQSPVWKQWAIDLQAIADQNVNLQAVKSLTIGVGDNIGAAAGGTGTLFIDDIGLHDNDLMP